MGVRTIARHYGATDMLVHIHDGSVLFGTEMCPDFLVVSNSGKIEKITASIGRYQEICDYIKQAPDKFVALLAEPEPVENPTTVYVYRNGKVEADFCKKPGFPNTTVDGELMYDNVFFLNAESCRQNAIANLQARIDSCAQRAARLREELALNEERAQHAQSELAQLNA